MKPSSSSTTNPHWRVSPWRPSRRELLFGAGSFGVLGAFAEHARAEVLRSGARPRASADVCIFVNLQGAPSHVDTFDLKTDAFRPPTHVLGGAGPITLNATLFPNLAQMAGDLCLIRSMQSVEEAHPRGQFAVRTAHSSNPASDGETPHIGAVVAYEKGVGKFPPFLALNGPTEQGAAFLGGAYGPLVTSGCGYPYFEHNFYGAASQTRFSGKYNLLKSLDQARTSPSDPAVADATAYYDTARNMMYDTNVTSAFSCLTSDLTRYGNTAIGQSLLVARKAVQARNGVRFINVNHGNWDTHQQMYARGYRLANVLNNVWDLANELDRALGALIADLKASGDLARTMIVLVGEFGRTPGPLNGQQGRDHYKAAMSALLVGGGVGGGRVIGATDADGRIVVDFGWKKQRAVYIQDIVATVYSALGIDWGTTITGTPSGRAYQYTPTINNGNSDVPAPVDEVFS